MAITPQEANRLTEDDATVLERLETEIDGALRRNAPLRPDGARWIDIRWPNNRVRDELTRRYEEAGWRVKWHSDQRDGSCLILTPIRGPHG